MYANIRKFDVGKIALVTAMKLKHTFRFISAEVMSWPWISFLNYYRTDQEAVRQCPHQLRQNLYWKGKEQVSPDCKI